MPNYLEAPKRNALLGLLSDAAGRVNAFAQTPDPTMPMGKANPLLSLLSEFAGVPAVQRTLDRLSYGEPITNAGKANVPLIPADTADAAMALAPIAQIAGKYTGKAANSIADASVRAITRNPQATAASVLDYAAQMRPATPATVWHGSPHKFDAFDSSKIGTGEGAQAYGHGLYLAEDAKVAGSYQDKLSGVLPTEIAAGGQALDFRAAAAQAFGDESAEALIKSGAHMKPEAWSAVADVLRSKGLKDARPVAGSLYKVDLPDEKIARMLDWDKPLSQQPENVKKLFDDSWNHDIPGSEALSYLNQELASLGISPENRYSQTKVAAWLRKNGVPGIRYLDGGSRGAGGGTSNFVVFPGEENALTILERNGKPVR